MISGRLTLTSIEQALSETEQFSTIFTHPAQLAEAVLIDPRKANDVIQFLTENPLEFKKLFSAIKTADELTEIQLSYKRALDRYQQRWDARLAYQYRKSFGDLLLKNMIEDDEFFIRITPSSAEFVTLLKNTGITFAITPLGAEIGEAHCKFIQRALSTPAIYEKLFSNADDILRIARYRHSSFGDNKPLIALFDHFIKQVVHSTRLFSTLFTSDNDLYHFQCQFPAFNDVFSKTKTAALIVVSDNETKAKKLGKHDIEQTSTLLTSLSGQPSSFFFKVPMDIRNKIAALTPGFLNTHTQLEAEMIARDAKLKTRK